MLSPIKNVYSHCLRVYIGSIGTHPEWQHEVECYVTSLLHRYVQQCKACNKKT